MWPTNLQIIIALIVVIVIITLDRCTDARTEAKQFFSDNI